jgi:hypothetical protein
VQIRYVTSSSRLIDLGWGFSRTAFILTEFVDQKRVVYAQQFDRPDFDRLVKHTYNLIREYGLDNGTNKAYVDGSAPSFITTIKTSEKTSNT